MPSSALLLELVADQMRVAARAANSTTGSKAATPNPMHYIPSIPLALGALALFLIVTVIHSWNMWKNGGRYMVAAIIGGYAYAFGLGTRIPLHSNPDNLNTFLIMNLLVSLAPCGFIASTYMLLGRLAVSLRCPHHLLIPANRITLVFVLSDVVTFLVQAAGAAMITSKNASTAKLASHLFQTGLIIQLISFVFFTFVFSLFVFRVNRAEPATWLQDSRKGLRKDWRALAGAIFLSCIGILVRNFYRVIQVSAGATSHLSTTEGFFYALDSLPLFCGIAVYVPFWPGRFIPDGLDLKAKYADVYGGGSSQNISMVGLTGSR